MLAGLVLAGLVLAASGLAAWELAAFELEALVLADVNWLVEAYRLSDCSSLFLFLHGQLHINICRLHTVYRNSSYNVSFQYAHRMSLLGTCNRAVIGVAFRYGKGWAAICFALPVKRLVGTKSSSVF